MARFPIRELRIIAGFTAHPDIFAGPTIPIDEILEYCALVVNKADSCAVYRRVDG